MFLFNRHISMLMLSISCCFASLQADFISLSVWERTTATGHKQHLICLGDNHDLTSKADEQSDDLIEFLNRRSNSNDIVLIEDRFNYAYIIEQARAYCKKNNEGWDESCLHDVQLRYDDEFKLDFELQFFGRLSLKFGALIKVGQKIADKESIRSFNVDFRGLADSSTFTCLSQDWADFLRWMDHFVVKQVIKEIQNYDDSEFLNGYYQRCIDPLRCILKETGAVSMWHIRHFLGCYNGNSLFNFCPHHDSFYYKLYASLHSERNSDRLSKDLLCELMDARLLHHIYQGQMQQECANVVAVCAGVAHTLNIEQKLPALGYTCIDRDGVSSCDDIVQGLSLSQSLKESLDKLYLRQQTEEEKREKQIKRQAKIERRIKHILSGLDDNIMLDLNMYTDTQRSPAKLQAKL